LDGKDNVIAKRWGIKKATIGLIAAAAILVSGH